MDDKEILIKLMATAVRKGWDLGEEFFTETPTEFYLLPGMDLYFSLVFDHGFAKAIWSEEWEHHIKEMVLSDNPLQYAAQFLEEDEKEA